MSTPLLSSAAHLAHPCPSLSTFTCIGYVQIFTIRKQELRRAMRGITDRIASTFLQCVGEVDEFGPNGALLCRALACHPVCACACCCSQPCVGVVFLAALGFCARSPSSQPAPPCILARASLHSLFSFWVLFWSVFAAAPLSTQALCRPWWSWTS